MWALFGLVYKDDFEHPTLGGTEGALNPAFEVFVTETLPQFDSWLLAVYCWFFDINIRQRHTIERVGLYHGIYCHVFKYQFFALIKTMVKLI